MTRTVIPKLRMTNAEASLGFYAALGFTVDRAHRFVAGMPLFAQLTRDGQTSCSAEHVLTAHAGDCAIDGAVYFKVPDVDACARAFTGADVPIKQPPWNTDRGTREMLLIDPDHHRLRFAQHAD